MLFFWVCDMRLNLYVYSLYRNPDIDNQIFYCLLASMAAVQAEDVCASFLFVDDLNGHHQQWLGSIYPEWPHRQCIGLAFRRSHVRLSVSAVNLVICSPH